MGTALAMLVWGIANYGGQMDDFLGELKPTKKGRPSKAALVAEAVALLLDEKEMMGLKMPEIKAKIDFARGEIEKAEQWPDVLDPEPIAPDNIEPEVKQTIEDIPQCNHKFVEGVRVIDPGGNYVCDRCHLCGKESNRL